VWLLAQAAQEGEAAARRALQATKGAAKEAHISTAEATEQTIRDLSGQISELRQEHEEVGNCVGPKCPSRSWSLGNS
jgi:hypothetical protein